MNFLLTLYLTFIRGPQLMREREEKEAAERRAKEEQDRKNGVIPTCKKCDTPLDDKARPDKAMTKDLPGWLRERPLCRKCIIVELADAKAAAAQPAVHEELKMTPFLWFQVFIICVALTAFFHRNVMPLF
ncbi:hypothetical protein ATCC90586_006857 [Pythium insidiosum]|nr:hypothetical protein ATCC90586_006857 [Pythium insidiosum]